MGRSWVEVDGWGMCAFMIELLEELMVQFSLHLSASADQ